MIPLPFRNREDAARRLVAALLQYRGQHPLVLAIPRGAVPMGRIVADELGGELDVVLVRKLGAPGNPELAIGAIDERGEVTLNENAGWVGADDSYVHRESDRQLALIRERSMRYRAGRPAQPVVGRTVIVLDDGVATGATMIAALRAVRAQKPERLVCAVPVAARDSLEEIEKLADDVVCLATPSPFGAVGLFYSNFTTVDDDEVAQALAHAADAPAKEAAAPPVGVQLADTELVGAQRIAVGIPIGQVLLEGDLTVPPSAEGVVLFAHGSGSSRHSIRNRAVAEALSRRGFTTLLFDLLTMQEDQQPSARFDISLLMQRLDAALQWVRQEPACRHLPIALFGASTGAAAALAVAATRPGEVAAVVSRGGRPDLAGPQILSQIRTPTLLIVGGADREVLELNRSAQEMMGAWAELVVVPGATHLFEEPGALEQVALLAGDWFARWLHGGAASEQLDVGQARPELHPPKTTPRPRP